MEINKHKYILVLSPNLVMGTVHLFWDIFYKASCDLDDKVDQLDPADDGEAREKSHGPSHSG